MKNTRSHSEPAAHQTRKGHPHFTNQHGIEVKHPKSTSSGESTTTDHKKDRVSKSHQKDTHTSEHTAAPRTGMLLSTAYLNIAQVRQID
jgi:hypothetical protein